MPDEIDATAATIDMDEGDDASNVMVGKEDDAESCCDKNKVKPCIRTFSFMLYSYFAQHARNFCVIDYAKGMYFYEVRFWF